MFMRQLVAVLVLIAFGVGTANAQSKRINGKQYYGCTSRAYFEKLIEYRVQKDKEAFKEALTDGVLRGACTLFNNGDEVYTVETAIFSGLVRLRRKGGTAEYWTNIEATK